MMGSGWAWTAAGAVAVGWSLATTPGRSAARTLDDQIVVSNAQARDAAMVVIHGKESRDACPDVPISGGGTHDVANIVPPSSCQVVVFTKYHPVVEASPQWTDGSDVVNITVGDDPPALDLNLFVVTEDGRADAWAKADVSRAQRVFRRNRVGLTFTMAKFVGSGTLSANDIATIGDDCAHAEDIASNFPQYNKDRLNVFYVDLIDADEWYAGYNCFEPHGDSGFKAPNIIFISVGARSANTLAHEIGHALGLQLANGHTGPPDEVNITGFQSTNIMWTGIDPDRPDKRKYFSLGQAYRMNADDDSWAHALKSWPGLPARACHPSGPLNRTPCPPLALDVP
jgi:hypothetical protein